MVNKTYKLNPEDAKKLISYACRYRGMTTKIDQTHDVMRVYTTFADNDKPTSIADRFQLIKIKDETPKMPREEYERRVLGKFLQKE